MVLFIINQTFWDTPTRGTPIQPNQGSPSQIGFPPSAQCLAAAVASQFLDVGTLAADQQPGPRAGVTAVDLCEPAPGHRKWVKIFRDISNSSSYL